MRTVPYLIFNGNCEEAMKFYAGVFGTEPQIMRFDGMPEGDGPPMSAGYKNKVMHGELKLGSEYYLYFSDTFEGGSVSVGDNITLHIDVDSQADVDRYCTALAEGGTVEMEPGEVFWGAYYASLVDKFGIGWGLHFQLPE